MPREGKKWLPVLQVEAGALARRALVVGDPARAEAAAQLLDQPRLLNQNREYATYTGIINGIPIEVSSSLTETWYAKARRYCLTTINRNAQR